MVKPSDCPVKVREFDTWHLFFFFPFFFFLFYSPLLIILIAPPHQVRTAAISTPTTPAGAAPSLQGLFCLVCVVLVLVAVRFVSWTMMAELCISVHDFLCFIGNFSKTAPDTAKASFFFLDQCQQYSSTETNLELLNTFQKTVTFNSS